MAYALSGAATIEKTSKRIPVANAARKMGGRLSLTGLLPVD